LHGTAQWMMYSSSNELIMEQTIIWFNLRFLLSVSFFVSGMGNWRRQLQQQQQHYLYCLWIQRVNEGSYYLSEADTRFGFSTLVLLAFQKASSFFCTLLQEK
jgi:hypothetical protein